MADPASIAKIISGINFIVSHSKNLLNNAKETGKTISDISNAKKELLGQTKYSKTKEEIGEFLEVLQKLEEVNKLIQQDPNLLSLPLVKDFSEKNGLSAYLSEYTSNQRYVLINKKTNEYALPDENLTSQVLTKAREEKTKDVEKKVSLVDFKEVDSFKAIAGDLVVPKEFYRITPYLDTTNASLLALSIQVEELYVHHRFEEAESLKRESIQLQYKSEGVKFCNLYHQGYLKQYFTNLCQREDCNRELVNREIDKFIRSKANSIFFVHPYTNREKLVGLIVGFLKQKKDYVAVHGLGNYNKNIAANVIETIENRKDLNLNGYYVREITGRNPEPKGRNAIKSWRSGQIWFTESGKDIYSLIKD